ncbi:uncharacterized protein JCM6883_004679 [Sporobolomyces salmoneus]|uniref:uncharacterized protein n=1 Tax=Sporobolomyces salmoneus TaxID=183962 RepID=UPI0031738256
MNIFRILGDVAHLLAVSFLIFKLHTSRSLRGLSFTTQVLYLVVYCYLDTLWQQYQVSMYNTVGKVCWFGSSVYIVAVMKLKFSASTRDHGPESIRIEHLAGPCLALALCFNHLSTATEVLWTFSIYLEAVAILPQLFLTYKLRHDNERGPLIEPADGDDGFVEYLVLMSSYRAFYIANWIHRYLNEQFVDPISMYGGLVQTGFYVAFFVLYYLQ